MAAAAPDTVLAVDVGCGNGQLTGQLAGHFDQVLGLESGRPVGLPLHLVGRPQRARGIARGHPARFRRRPDHAVGRSRPPPRDSLAHQHATGTTMSAPSPLPALAPGICGQGRAGAGREEVADVQGGVQRRCRTDWRRYPPAGHHRRAAFRGAPGDEGRHGLKGRGATFFCPDPARACQGTRATAP